jgi:GT2 family glycosyltransferase
LCWRFNARGKEVYCIPQSIVYHVGAATLSSESPRKTFLNFRNNMLMLYKNLGYERFKGLYYTRIGLDYLAALQMLCTGKLKNAKAVIDAKREFKSIRKNYKKVREENLRKRTVKPIKTIYPYSLLWHYFILGQRRFNNLKWKR